MEVTEIVRRLEGATGRFERAALEAAVGRREEIVPELLRILDDAVVHASERARQDNYLGHIYAVYLLAQFREPRAYPALIRLAQIPSEVLDDLFADFTTDGLSQTVASVWDGDVAGIQSVIENADALEWARGAMVRSLATLVANGKKNRDEVLDYFATLFRGRLERTPSHVWDALADVSAHLCSAELIDDIEQAYEEGLIDPSFVDLEEIRERIGMSPAAGMNRLRADKDYQLMDNIIKKMEWWACFDEDDAKSREAPKPTSPLVSSSVPAAPKAPKVGRNDPCSCGSGKKYKKCCGT